MGEMGDEGSNALTKEVSMLLLNGPILIPSVPMSKNI